MASSETEIANAALRHLGAHNLAEARDIELRHPGAWNFTG